MFSSCSEEGNVTVRGINYTKHVILADVNIPYKLTIDRNRNILFFCINADQFSDQSFHSVLLNLDTGSTSIVPGIRNGFASAVDQVSGAAYLGGSDGVFLYNHLTNDVDTPAVIYGIDIFDMFYKDHLYFVDTGTQTLHIVKGGQTNRVPYIDRYSIHHFIVDNNYNIYFVNPTGLFIHRAGSKSIQLLDDTPIQYRGAAIDTNGEPFFIARDGIYAISETTYRPELLLPIHNAFGLAFDNKDNIIYSDERSVVILTR